MKLLFWIYMLNNTLCLFFGIIYLSKLKLMAYHEEVIKMKWDDLQPELQILFKAFMAAVGNGFIIVALLNYTILLIPFYRGEFWAILAIPLIGIIGGIGGFLIAQFLHKKAGARTPRLPFVISNVIYVTGLIFSLI